MWNPFARSEKRSVDYAQYPLNGANIFELFNGGQISSSDVVVNEETAMRVPAYFGGVNFLAGTLAGLPLQVFDKGKDGRKRVTAPFAQMLHGAVNDETSSFEWRKRLFEQVFTTGRGLSWIERDGNRIVNIWNIDPKCAVVKRKNGRKFYEYTENGKTTTYEASEIIDIPFMLRSDGLLHRGPLSSGRDALGLAIAANEYGAKYLANGGVPPFAITGNFQSKDALKAASNDLDSAVRKAAKEKRLALTLPIGLEIKEIGGNPENSQLVELQRFSVEQIARLLQLPPVFLQDLTHGTFSNTEQQDLHLVKHTLKRWAEQFEQELNLKLFGRSNNKRYVELNMDGLLRGDFKTRMDGYSQAIQTGHLMPSEAREIENRPFVEGSDRLFIQGATVPLDKAGEAPAPTPTGATNDE
jgi:HK97 family phage portal protein